MLTTENIALRPLTADDAPILFDWINDRALTLNNAPYRPVSARDHQQWFERITSDRDSAIFGVVRIPSADMIGVCQLIGINWIHRSAELLIRIGKADARGKGYGTEAVRLLLEHAFRDLNLNRVSLHVFATNAAALRAYEKAGFVREGVRRRAAFIDGRYVDIVLMGMLRDEHAG